MKTVTIVVCYLKGTARIMETWLSSVARHSKDTEYKVVILTKSGHAEELKDLVLSYDSVRIVEVDLPDNPRVSSRIHGKMIDEFIPRNVDSEFVITMDSDSFPIADGWIRDMVGILDGGYRVTGILHPWAPPTDDMDKKLLEWRVRSQHCWNNTHVACQMIRTADVWELGVKYGEGDDTGLLIPQKARERGWEIKGFKVTRCPKPLVGGLDPEFNRYVCLVFGDKVYHHGGFSRTKAGGDKQMFEGEFRWVEERILKENGAEFLLNDDLSYQFKFDREEEVSKEKMTRLFGLSTRR